jgi:hypothetical protein
MFAVEGKKLAFAHIANEPPTPPIDAVLLEFASSCHEKKV